MLKKDFRLKRRSAFTATYKVQHSYYYNGVVLFVGILKTQEQPTKVGFVVSKKTHKRAVRRNCLKRLMRESYRLLQKEDSLANSQKFMSLIFIGKENALKLNFEEMKSTIKNLLERIKIND